LPIHRSFLTVSSADFSFMHLFTEGDATCRCSFSGCQSVIPETGQCDQIAELLVWLTQIVAGTRNHQLRFHTLVPEGERDRDPFMMTGFRIYLIYMGIQRQTLTLFGQWCPLLHARTNQRYALRKRTNKPVLTDRLGQ